MSKTHSSLEESRATKQLLHVNHINRIFLAPQIESESDNAHAESFDCFSTRARAGSYLWPTPYKALHTRVSLSTMWGTALPVSRLRGCWQVGEFGQLSQVLDRAPIIQLNPTHLSDWIPNPKSGIRSGGFSLVRFCKLVCLPCEVWNRC